MNAPAPIPTDTLPILIDRAAHALSEAKTSAEVLEARDLARVAYDAAKSAGRIAKAKQAHDTIMIQVHRAQAHALGIRARAEMRLADEYDAAQERGEVRSNGERTFFEGEKLGAGDLGLSGKDIHEARKLRDAEQAAPGLIQRTVDEMVDRGEEPTRAALKRNITPKATMQREPLWVWGRVKDFERDGILAISPTDLAAGMTEPMRTELRRILPRVRAYLKALEDAL